MLKDKLGKEIIVFDGAMGTSIQNIEIGEDVWKSYQGCSEWLNIAAPDIVKQIHEDYLKAGCDVIESNTFGGTELVMSEYGLEDKTYELNLKGAVLARETADKYGRYTAGSIGPGTKLPSLSQIHYDDLYTMYVSQCRALIEGGSDLLMIETCQDTLQIKAAVAAAMKAKDEAGADCPVFVSVTVEQTGSMLMGTDLAAVSTLLRGYPVDSLGINCAVGPDLMHNPLSVITANWDRHISCVPNAGLPETVDGKVVYNMNAEKMAELMSEIVGKYPIAVIGGCCGTTPGHIKALSDKCGAMTPNKPSENIEKGVCSSLFQKMALSQKPAPSLIGERANANGSKAFRELLLDEDFEGMLSVARKQETEGAHFIDICTAYAGRDGAYFGVAEGELLGQETQSRLEIFGRYFPFYREGFYIDDDYERSQGASDS